jgi:hypothetical protein
MFFNRFMQFTTLLTSFAIAGVAAYFSVIGLATIFAGATLSVIIMASILEVGKLVSAVWLHIYWKSVSILARLYLLVAVIVLMFITSAGIFGYLSKAHIETGAAGGEYQAQIERLENRIVRHETTISRANNTLDDLDASLDKFVELGAVTRGLEARREQQEQRDQLNEVIDEAYSQIDLLNEQIADIKINIRAYEVEVGPIKYIAELVYGDTAEDMTDEAIRYMMLLLIFVFDPLAVILLITAMKAIKDQRKLPVKKSKKNISYIDPKDIVKMESI